ncbi:CD9 antigen-like isoform X2 [Ceratina calcarata]|uniref:Tetraspanin n=1 Tax=Ceratina calcarata TaxID=156304 RepID=A0AAJ7JD02_9HYME|nr:CD9 antigen-like isoform X2 [Ceratina calcarata]
MVLSKCYGCVKYLLVCVNVVFWVIGLAAIVVTSWLLSGHTFLVSLAQQQHDNFYAGLYILLAAGILAVIVSFLGCCGTFRESRCMLVTFFSCLLVIIVAQIAAGAWLTTNSGRLEELVKNSVLDSVKNKYGEDPSYTDTVDTFQSELGCCGATGPADWTGSKYATRDPSIPVSLTVSGDANNLYKVPDSCCKVKDSAACKAARDIRVGSAVSPAIYSEGCVDKLIATIDSQKSIVIVVCVSILIVELLGLIFSSILYCAIRFSDRYVKA